MGLFELFPADDPRVVAARAAMRSRRSCSAPSPPARASRSPEGSVRLVPEAVNRRLIAALTVPALLAWDSIFPAGSPQVLPLQVVTVGNLALVAVPFIALNRVEIWTLP